MKQTAMQMAINHYKKLSEQGSNQAYLVAKFLEENFLEVEEQQIIDARQDGYESTYNSCESGCMGEYILEGSNEQYYNETFKSE